MKAFVLCVLLVARVPSAIAELSAPDNILYGTIALNGIPVLPANTTVVVEARRTAGGPAIATYRMGDNADAAAFYALKIPIEEQAPLDAPATSSLKTDTLFIVVRSGITDRGQTTYTIPERGNVLRLDFDIDPPAGPPDTDSDGLPDSWEQSNFGGLSQGPNDDWDHDGISNGTEYIAGTNPMNANGPFQLIPSRVGSNEFVSFFSVSTVGIAGYEGSTRHYAIEGTPNLVTPTWLALPGYNNILGSNGTVTVPVPVPAPRAFYRGKVWLTRP